MSQSMHRWLSGVAILFLDFVGCGGSNQPFERPAIHLITQTLPGLCSTNLVIDYTGAVWSEQGCEASSSGWKRIREPGSQSFSVIDPLYIAAHAEYQPTICNLEAKPTSRPQYFVIRYQAAEDEQTSFAVCQTLRFGAPGPPPHQKIFLDAMKEL